MPLITCPECGYMVSTYAQRCPNCGNPSIPKNDTGKTGKTFVRSSDRKDPNAATNHGEKPKNSKARTWILVSIAILLLAINLFVWINYFKTDTPQNTVAYTVPEATYLYGRICADNDCYMEITENSGRYIFDNYIRTLKVEKYNTATNNLILSAYDINGENYIGRFDGTLTKSSFSGNFKNYKGVECTFDMRRIAEAEHEEAMLNAVSDAAAAKKKQPKTLNSTTTQ